MSDQPTARATPPPTAKKPAATGKKYAGLTRNQWYIAGGVFAAALAYILWKRRASAAAAAGSQSPTSAGSNECTDANGNPVDCGELEASELAALQNSLDQLGAASGSSGSSGGGDGSSGGTAPVTTTGTGATSTTQPPATPVTSGGATTSATAAAKTAGAVTGLKASAVTKTSFKASWSAAANATGGYAWIVRDLASHTQVSSGSTKNTSVTVSGLKPGTDYNFGVQGLPGGVGDNIHVRTS
jgi:Fibronectin type III domain